MLLRTFLFACLLTPLIAAPQTTTLETELQKIDRIAADNDARPAALAAIADALKVHRNHLILLRKETGESFGQIFAQSLRKEGLSDDQILARTVSLEKDIQNRLAQEPGGNAEPLSGGERPALILSTGVDHNSAGTFVWLNPEIGIDSKWASLVVGVPCYRNSSGGVSASGVGDAYARGSLYGRAAGLEMEGSLTLGLPTGDKNLGLGAGKTTVDATATIARRFERVRPFVSAGFANSTFNFAYLRPYVADGNAAHFSGGVDLRAAERLTVGAGGFGVIPGGSQVVYSRVAMGQAAGAQGSGANGNTPGSGSGNGMGGMGSSAGGPVGPAAMPQIPAKMPFLATSGASVASSELMDYGANAWASVTVARGVTLNFALARSVPFQLTTVRAGVAFDVVRILSHAR